MKVIRVIEKNNRFVLSLAEAGGGSMSLIKSFAEDHPSLDSLAQLRNELHVGTMLKHPGLREVSGEVFYNNRKCLLLNFIEGENSKGKGPIGTPGFFNFSIQLARILEYVHKEGVFHRDISANNILYDKSLDHYYLIDFGTAILGNTKKGVNSLVGTPAYTSPELTGRLQLIPDIRADIYSLGVVFYEMLTGINPFEDPSEMQIIYKHLAHIPPAPDQLGQSIPSTISRIIMKMLAKNPDERYQSMSGLAFDLEEALLLYKRNVDPSDFRPGGNELRIPYNANPTFTGYEKEIKQLKEHFPKLLGGKTHMHVVSGAVGIGKSGLIHQLLPGFYEEQVMYIRLENGSTIKPHAYLFDLFEKILSRINEESESQILKRKERFHAENLSDVSILIDSIPALEKYTEGKESSHQLSSIQSQNRFQLALQDLLRILALPERPIVIHLANEAQLDRESLDFFKKFVEDVQDEFIWILSEVEEMKDRDFTMGTHGKTLIELHGLSDQKMEELFKEMIIGEFNQKEGTLAKLKKYAGGNPKRAVTLINYWYNNQFLTFDPHRNYWYWQDSPSLPLFPESIVKEEFFEDEVQKDMVEWASVIDGKFSMDMIMALSEFSEDLVKKALQSLNLQSQLVSFRNGNQTEYFQLSSTVDPHLLIPDDRELAARHLAIATYLEEHTQDFFRIAHHLNEAKKLGNSDFNKGNALKMNHEAGLLAKEQGAFNLARKFFQHSIDFLDDVPDLNPDLRFSLYINTAELAQLEGDHKDTEEQFAKAFALASTDIQKAEVYTRQMTLLNHQGKLEECFTIGRKALDILGFPIPEKAGKAGILRKLIRLRFKLGKTDPLKLVDLPPIQDKKVILALQILEDLHPAIFNKSSDLLAYVILSSFEKILAYGNSPEGYSAYAGFGAILALGFNNYRKGWEFTLAGTEMTQRFPNKMYHGRGLYSKGGWIIYYVQNMINGVPILEEGMRLSRESGDFTYATFGAMNLMEILFMLGKPLPEYEKKVDEFIAFTHQIGYRDILAMSLVSKDFILKLSGQGDQSGPLSEKWFNGQDLGDYTGSTSFKYLTIYHKILQATICFYENNFTKGNQIMTECESLLHVLKGPPLLVNYYFYKGVLGYENARLTEGFENQENRKRLRLSTKKLKKYAGLIEDNFGHRYAILQAMELDLNGEHYQSRNMMRKAIELARKYDYIQIEAMAAHYLAKWFNKQGQKDYARLHFRDAISAYERWGASYVVSLLDEEFTEFSSGHKSHTGSSAGNSYSGYSQSGKFSNPEVLMQSALTVAAETDIEALLGVMNQIFLEQAGATRSLLFVLSQQELGLLYEMEQENKTFYPFPGKRFKSIDRIPKSIIQLVQRSQETIYIEDTSSEQRFRFESYLRDVKPFSILVIPMIYRGVLSGIIYFENTLLTQAFSTERRELIYLLSGQFAVALQNAQLVEELEIRVRDRTLALESEKDRSDHLLRNILPAETAEELKIKGTATPRYYENVTVMFTDFTGFTQISEKMHPAELVKMLDYYFREFDRIIEKHGLEKIKTIGDAYMCVSGLPVESNDHALRAVRAAFDIHAFIDRTLDKQTYPLHLRIGIHSGPVVAGVVGENKFAFDIWGDTVNTASRMETNSSNGRINITKVTKELLADHSSYDFEYRGKVPAKNKGEIDMYFINENKSGSRQYQEAIAYILSKLEEELPENLSYHSPGHTDEIMENVQIIGAKEGVSDDEMILLLTAAAYHDSGFLTGPTDHEEKSCRIAHEILPNYGFTGEENAQICRMIRATKIPQKPLDLLSMILCDADLYYLGTDTFYSTGEKLFREFKSQGVVKTEKDWLELQIKFLESHSYHTKTAHQHCDAKKQKHLEELKNELMNYTD